MFTGIIEAVGDVESVTADAQSARIDVRVGALARIGVRGILRWRSVAQSEQPRSRW